MILPTGVSIHLFTSHPVICIMQFSLILILYVHFISVPDCLCVGVCGCGGEGGGGSFFWEAVSPTYTKSRLYQMGIPHLDLSFPGYVLISVSSNVLICKTNLCCLLAVSLNEMIHMTLPATGSRTQGVLTDLASFLPP